MDVEVNVSGESRELASSEEEEHDGEDYDPEDAVEESDEEDYHTGDAVEESDPEADERGSEVMEDLSEEEEDEEDYCPGGYHPISSGDLLKDG